MQSPLAYLDGNVTLFLPGCLIYWVASRGEQFGSDQNWISPFSLRSFWTNNILLERISLLEEIEDCWSDRLSYGDQVWGSWVRFAVRQAARRPLIWSFYHLELVTMLSLFPFSTHSVHSIVYFTVLRYFFMPGRDIAVECEWRKTSEIAQTSLIASTTYESIKRSPLNHKVHLMLSTLRIRKSVMWSSLYDRGDCIL